MDVYEYTSSTLLLALLLGRPGIERDGDIPKPNSMTANEIVVISGLAHGRPVDLNHAVKLVRFTYVQ